MNACMHYMITSMSIKFQKAYSAPHCPFLLFSLILEVLARLGLGLAPKIKELRIDPGSGLYLQQVTTKAKYIAGSETLFITS